LLQSYRDIVVVFVGDGVVKDALERDVRRRELENVLFLPLQGRDTVPDVFGLADISLVVLSGSIVSEAVPSKLFSIMASGRPVIATVHPGTETARIINRAECGICIPPDDPAALGRAVIQLYEDGRSRVEMGNKGRQFAVANYSRKHASDAYADLIRRSVRHGSGLTDSDSMIWCEQTDMVFNAIGQIPEHLHASALKNNSASTVPPLGSHCWWRKRAAAGSVTGICQEFRRVVFDECRSSSPMV